MCIRDSPRAMMGLSVRQPFPTPADACYQSVMLSEKSWRMSASVGIFGETTSNRCCGKVPATSASRSASVMPTPLSPFGMPICFIIDVKRSAMASPAFCSSTSSGEAPSRMAASPDEVDEQNAGDAIAERFTSMMKQIGMPNGLKGVGITDADLDALVAGTLPQQRLLVVSPKMPTEADIRQLFSD